MKAGRGKVVLAAALCALALPGAASAAQSARFVTDEGRTKTFFDHGGLQLIGVCDPGADPQLQVLARSRSPQAMLHLNSQSDRDADASDEEDYFESDDLGATPVPVLNGLSDDGSGQLLYSTRGGTTVSVDWAAEEDGVLGGRVCAFFGTAHVATRREDSGTLPRVSFREDAGAAPRTFYRARGLELSGSCDPDGGGADLDIAATSSVDNALLHANAQGAEARYFEDDDFDDGAGEVQDPIPLLDELDVDGAGSGADDTSGQIVYSRANGTHVRIDWMAEEDDGHGGEQDCAFVGTSKTVTRGHPHRIDFRAAAGTGGERLFWKAYGLKLIGSCEAGMGGAEMTITAQSRKPLTTLHANSQAAGDLHSYFEDDAFAVGNAGELDLTAGLGAGDDAAGQLVFAGARKKHLSVDWTAEVEDAYGGATDCVFAGSGEVPK